MATAAVKSFWLDNVDWGGGVFGPSLEGAVKLFPLIRGSLGLSPILRSGVKLIARVVGRIKYN